MVYSKDLMTESLADICLRIIDNLDNLKSSAAQAEAIRVEIKLHTWQPPKQLRPLPAKKPLSPKILWPPFPPS